MQPQAIQKALTETALYQYLQRKGDSFLVAMVDAVAPCAIEQLGRIVEHMPLYTLHNHVHIHNVIRWMERLLGTHIEQLSGLEAALLLLAAHVHDLGMVLSEAQYRVLTEGNSPERLKYLRFRDGFPVELEHIKRLRDEKDEKKDYLAKLLDNALLTDFLRSTHSDTGAVRMRQQVDAIITNSGNGALLTYSAFDLRPALELLCISHNQPVSWLCGAAQSQLQCEVIRAGGQTANLPYLGVILRLADIMDFDSTRTPRILFRHLGLDEEMANRFEEKSNEEWRKHLAIDSWEWPDAGDLTYYAPMCPDPATHKSILQFVEWIQKEVDGAPGELAQDARMLRLPDKVEATITPRLENGCPTYKYEDWSFALQQDEILQLLMGVNLYGDPGLAIRELLQNSLDALELRDLRLQLKKKLREQYRRECAPVDGSSPRPGWFRDEFEEEHELAVDLTWGVNEKGEQWIRVEDNGVGMSKAVIEGYFTRIGKSYYKSPEFHREQTMLKAHGLLSAPISQFGIGVLSCFMIADRLEVETKAAGEEAVHLAVTGPGNLFWTKTSSRTRQGTAVTLWLKKKIEDVEVQLGHDRTACIGKLRKHFGYSREDVDYKSLDPACIAAQHVVWPKYPVKAQGGFRIDADFHFKELSPLDPKRFYEDAEKLGVKGSMESPQWARWEWNDAETSSRIAIWHVMCGASSKATWPHDVEGQAPAWQLATVAERQLPAERDRILSVGMFVDDTRLLREVTAVASGVGTAVWVDYRGTAAPQLKADRSAVIKDLYREEMAQRSNLLERFFGSLKSTIASVASGRNVLALRMCKERRTSMAEVAVRASGPQPFRTDSLWSVGFFSDLARDLALALARVLDRDLDLARVLALARNRALDLARNLALDLDLARVLARNLALARDLARDLDLALARDLARDLVRQFAPTDGLRASVGANWLVEAFHPSLPESWPPLAVFGAQGRIGEGAVAGPALYLLPGEVRDADGLAHRVDGFEYDLCFPMTCIALGRLRSQCPEWASDRRLRPFFVFPFLAPSAAKDFLESAEKLVQLLKVDELYALMPATRLWHTEFRHWTADDWADCKHISLLWDIRKGEIKAMFGCQPRTTVRENGVEYVEFLQQGAAADAVRTD